jgi:hypothetical protein
MGSGDTVTPDTGDNSINRSEAETKVWLSNKAKVAQEEAMSAMDISSADTGIGVEGTVVDNDEQDEAGFDEDVEEVEDLDDEEKNLEPPTLPEELKNSIVAGVEAIRNNLLSIGNKINTAGSSDNDVLNNISDSLSEERLIIFFNQVLESLDRATIEGATSEDVAQGLTDLNTNITALAGIINSFEKITINFGALKNDIDEARYLLIDYEGISWKKFIPENIVESYGLYSNTFKSILTFQDQVESLITDEYEFDIGEYKFSNFGETSGTRDDLETEISDQGKIISFLQSALSLVSESAEEKIINLKNAETISDLGEDPGLDENVELVYDEGEGSSQDGVEDAAAEEAGEEAVILENETYEEYVEEEVVIEEAVPLMTAQDYLDLLESRNAGLADNEFFGNLPDGEDDPELVANFMLPASSLPNFDTMLTPSFISVDIPEPVPNFDDSKFVYNYYVADEESRSYIDQGSRKRMAEEFATVEDIEAALADEGQGRYYLPPRYNIVKFTSTVDALNQSINTTDEYEARSILSSNPNFKAIVEDIKRGNKLGEKLILTEGGLSTSKFSSSELINTDIQSDAVKKMFNILTLDSEIGKSRSITGNSEIFRDVSLEKFLDDYFDRNDIENSDQKKLVSNYLKSLSQESDFASFNKQETSLNSDIIRFASFPLTFDNASFYDVILSADLEFGGLLENELDSYKDYAFSFYEKARNGFSDGLSANDYEAIIPQRAVLDVEAYDPDIFVTDGNGLPETSAGLRPHIEHSGYIVEKIEIHGQTGNVQQKNPIFVPGGSTSFVDLDVLYGYDYIYKIRTLVVLEYDFVIPNTDAHDSQIARGAFLLASKYNPIRIRCQENIPPEHPISVKFKYESNSSYGTGINISWLYPHNPQRDIVGFEIYKRHSFDEPFTLLAVYNFKDPAGDINLESYKQLDDASKFVFNNPVTDFFDKNFNSKKESIYAVVSIDAHGMKSGYSPQYLVDFDHYTNQIKTKVVSKGGAPIAYPNYFLSDKLIKTFNEVAKTSNKNRITICFNPKYYDLNEKNTDGTSSRINLLSKSKDIDKNYVLSVSNVDIIKSKNIDISIDDRSLQSTSIFTNGNLQEENLSFSLTNNE